MRVIILAAGIGNALDGMVKCLIRHPVTKRTILDHIVEAYAGMDVTVVVGYRAVEVMQAYPELHYVYNREWAVTNNAYSLGLALDNRPTHVISGDFFISRKTIACIEEASPNVALVTSRENRPLTAIHCRMNNDRISECYMGPLQHVEHNEVLGVFKISDQTLLAEWKNNGLRHPNLFVAQTLPLTEDLAPIKTVMLGNNDSFCEINTVEDYLRLMNGE